MKKIKDNYWIFIIFALAIFFRFYDFPFRYGFDYDAMRDSLITHYIVNNLTLPLIGPPVSVGNFTFGPWYYYILALGEFIFRSPFSPWIVISLLSMGEVYIFYRIGKELEDKWLGYIYAALVAVSASQVVLATGLSNPNLVPFFASASLLIFIITMKRKFSLWLYILFGFIIGMGILAHYQMIGYILLPIFSIIYQRKKIVPSSLLFICGFSIALLPLVLVNALMHNQLFTAILTYLLHGSSNVNYVPNSWKIYLLDFWPTFWPDTLGLPFIIGMLSLLFTGITFAVLLIKRKVQIALFFILIVFLLNFIYFRFYQGERSAYYTYYLQPFIFLFFGYALYSLYQIKKLRYISQAVVILCIAIILFKSTTILGPNADQKTEKNIASQLMQRYPGRTIALYSCKGSQLYRPYGILFAMDLITQSGSLEKLGLQGEFTGTVCTSSRSESKFTYKTKGGPFNFIDLSAEGDAELYKQGWILVNEKNIYNSITQWWYPNSNAYSELKINK